jgi:hypothetical protein
MSKTTGTAVPYLQVIGKTGTDLAAATYEMCGATGNNGAATNPGTALGIPLWNGSTYLNTATSLMSGSIQVELIGNSTGAIQMWSVVGTIGAPNHPSPGPYAIYIHGTILMNTSNPIIKGINLYSGAAGVTFAGGFMNVTYDA